jgi:integrase
MRDFVEREYLPRIAEQKRPSTYAGYRDMWNNHLKPRCADLWLHDIRTRDIQNILRDIALDQNAMSRCARCGKARSQHSAEVHGYEGALSHNSLKHLKVALSGIFKFAKQMGAYDDANPVRDTAVPAARESEETYAYSLEEVTQILALLPEPAATIFAVAAFTGARRGEIRGLQWEDYRNGEIHITRSVWHGFIGEPKTRKSTGAIPVITPLAKRLEFHRSRMGWPEDGPMFPNGTGQPTDLNNLVVRVIVPELTRCAVCGKRKHEHRLQDHDFSLDENLPKWRGWHAARRGLGTNLYRLGVPEKHIQAILRHANVATTNTYYIKTASADAQAGMARLESLIGQQMGNGLRSTQGQPAQQRTRN